MSALLGLDEKRPVKPSKSREATDIHRDGLLLTRHVVRMISVNQAVGNYAVRTRRKRVERKYLVN